MSGTRMSTTRGQHDFARVPSVNIERSVFNRSFGHKTTFNAGLLVPIFVDEALPGDTFEVKMTSFGRLATLMRPIMDNIYLDVFFFFTPNRLLWSNWQKFNGEQDNPGDSTDFLVPQIVAPVGGFVEDSIYDYMGVPTKVAGLPISSLPLRAYNRIYNEWFRDENLCTRLAQFTDDGPDPVVNYAIQRRGKRHDYFTSCLPWPQKGTPVSLPLGTTAPVTGTPVYNIGTKNASIGSKGDGSDGATWAPPGAPNPGNSGGAGWPIVSGLTADLGIAAAATINQLREAFQIQRLLERDARGGTRYTEILRAHFGVISPDSRLQRPEYLGGGTVRINVNPIANTGFTAVAGATNSLGDLAGIGTFGQHGVGFKQSFTEHGVILGMVCMRADLNYQQGLERMWSRRTRYDFYWPALAHLGEQAVLNKEIFAQGTAADDLAFGYQERYAEYRYKPSYVSSRMRSNAATPLDSWHLAQDFASLPALNDVFIKETPPIDRVIAVTSALEPQAILDCFFEMKCARPMPVFGVPGLIDHF